MELIRKGSRWLIFGGLFTGVFVGSFLWTLSILIRSAGEVRVPALVGRTLNEATLVAHRSRLGVNILGQRYSDGVASGAVVEQFIPDGEWVREGRTVGIYLSRGPRERLTPRVIGMDSAMAETILRSSQLELRILAQACSDLVPAGKIISQRPLPGSQAAENSVASLVSTGLCTDRYVMADLVGVPVDEATRELDDAGFVLKSYQNEPMEGVLVPTVISSEPAAGSVVRLGEMITLVVSQDASAPVATLTEEIEMKWVYLPIESPPGFFRRNAQLRIRRAEPWAWATIDFLLTPGENAGLALWLSPGSDIAFVVNGQEMWKRTYEPDADHSPFDSLR